MLSEIPKAIIQLSVIDRLNKALSVSTLSTSLKRIECPTEETHWQLQPQSSSILTGLNNGICEKPRNYLRTYLLGSFVQNIERIVICLYVHYTYMQAAGQNCFTYCRICCVRYHLIVSIIT